MLAHVAGFRDQPSSSLGTLERNGELAGGAPRRGAGALASLVAAIDKASASRLSDLRLVIAGIAAARATVCWWMLVPSLPSCATWAVLGWAPHDYRRVDRARRIGAPRYTYTKYDRTIQLGTPKASSIEYAVLCSYSL